MVETECRDLREGFSCSSVGTMQKRDRDETTPYQPESPFADRDDSSRGLCYSGGGGGGSRAAGRRKTYRDVRTKLGRSCCSIGGTSIRGIFAGHLKEHFFRSSAVALLRKSDGRVYIPAVSKKSHGGCVQKLSSRVFCD
jgi:hypothetical protein